MRLIVAAGALALACTPPAALAQGYPAKPIRIMIPFVAGGSSDIVGRAIGSKFQEFLRQPAVVENRPGANGAIAAEFVAKSEADGYTILVGSIGVFSINAALFKDLRYRPLRDFAPITLAVTTPNVLIAKPTLPPDSVKELVELANKTPGRLSYCSSGSGSSDHLTGEVFRQTADFAAVHVPYKEVLDRWLWPDVLRNQDTSVVNAKQAISSYRKAVGDAAGLAELMVFYCERAAGFCSDIGNQDANWVRGPMLRLIRNFQESLKQHPPIPPGAPDDFVPY